MRLLLLVAVLVSPLALGAERPRLGVVIVVDQLSAEVFNARLPQAKAGLKRLAAEGLRYHELRFEAAPTVTSVGHATLATGANGEVHGIVGNEWYDAAAGQARLSTEDPAYAVLGREPQLRDCTAPTWLKAATLAEAVKGHHDDAKVVVISAKDRSAILTAGRTGDAVVWFDSAQPMFTTSTFYAKTLPAFVQPVNDALAKLVLMGAFAWGLPGGGTTGANPAPPVATRQGEREPLAEQPGIQSTLDALEVDLALAATASFKLGADAVPDLLAISFSGHDRIGHRFGPDAPEALSEFLSVDTQVGRLLDGLDAAVGKGRYTVVFTSDHGVMPMPEALNKRGLTAGRVDMTLVRAALEPVLLKATRRKDAIAAYKKPGFALNSKVREAALRALPKLRQAALTVPGVADLLSLDEVLDGDGGSEAALWKNGAVRGRSPDLIVVTKPYWLYGASDSTGHAGAYLYDRAVPLIISGPGIKPGRANVADAVDVAPTLSRLLNVPTPPSARGRPLPDVFR